MPRANLVADCSICQRVSYQFPGADVTGMTREEVFDVISPVVQKAGWAERTHSDARIKRYFICPSCLAQMAKDVKAMQPFDVATTCPKCGGGDLDTRYSTGKDAASMIAAEHLIRLCKRCGFKMAQATLDDSRLTPLAVPRQTLAGALPSTLILQPQASPSAPGSTDERATAS